MNCTRARDALVSSAVSTEIDAKVAAEQRKVAAEQVVVESRVQTRSETHSNGDVRARALTWTPEAALTDGERIRISARIARFEAKGMTNEGAVALARYLVIERDRNHERRFEGSCAECENFGSAGRCRATAEVGVEPRVVGELWACVYARRPN